jgi:hypothetical protein
MDPQSDWPLNSQQFTIYLTDKYAASANIAANTVLSYCTGTVHHYEKIITTVDNNTQTTSIKNVEIDKNYYLSLATSTSTQTFADGSTCTFTISKSAISIYDYEYNTNETKRNINLVNSSYASALETQYQTLVAA